MSAKKRRGRKGKGKGSIALSSAVKGATVRLDGRKVGTTPIRQLAVGPGAHALLVKKLGYLDFSQKVNVRPGKTSNVFVDLLPFAGVVNVKANIRKAKVHIDGKVVGKVPLVREIGVGRRKIEVSAEGYTPHEETIDAAPGNVYDVHVTLTRTAVVPDGGDDDLPLAALTAIPPPADEGSDLSLEPLPPDGDVGLELEPIGGAPDGDASGGGDLELMALPGTIPATDDLQLEMPGVGDEAVGGPFDMHAELAAPKPWYFEWYTLAGAAAAVTTGILTYAMVAGEDVPEQTIDMLWGPGDRRVDNPELE